jgi:2-succinyl-6-hydroxy-2,4-cyclohexadiene-1-carboxylate synthase
MASPDPTPPRLHATVRGAAGPRVVLVHGFTQTEVSWRPVVERLDADHEVVCVDAPAHGGSGAIHTDLAEGAGLLAALPEAGGRGGAVWVGYSMGARLVLRLALGAPPDDRPRGIVLLGGTAGIDDPSERAARRRADEDLARSIEADGVDAFLERWVAQPLFGPRALEPDDLAARRANRAEDLAASLRLAGTGTMDPPWWDDLGGVRCPALVCWGAHDAKFAALGLRLAAGLGGETAVAAIPGAHHAAHLDDPEAFAALVATFVAALA